MALPLPRSLSPSKVSAFKDCALAFRFSAIDKVPEPASVHTLKGTLVHSALERLYWRHPPGSRSPDAAAAELASVWRKAEDDGSFTVLELGDAEIAALRRQCETLVAADFAIEDPDSVNAVGVELTVEAEVGGLRLRGIIDRLDVTSTGELVVVDYKTGRVPAVHHEHSRLGGVQFYALLCEAVLGVRPAQVRLHYLAEPVTIESVPSDQTLRGLKLRTGAVWQAIERACASEDFRPRPSNLCRWCAFQTWCPAYGGDPDKAPRAALVTT